MDNVGVHVAANKIPIEIRIKTHILIDDKTGCWNWTGTKNPNGYGKMTMRDPNHKRYYSTAHRESYLLYHGPIINRMYVLHKCDNPSCCNPDHLYLGTNSDNQKDRYQRSKRFYRGNDGRFISGS